MTTLPRPDREIEGKKDGHRGFLSGLVNAAILSSLAAEIRADKEIPPRGKNPFLRTAGTVVSLARPGP